MADKCPRCGGCGTVNDENELKRVTCGLCNGSGTK